ncbi:ribulokinase [Treponema primitia]|uniref:ribulokinase n=1 Tax=Treponema primitia TaxID=88058 RepID=UPI00397E9FF3
MAKYVIGLDFGTKSGRALLADAKTGGIISLAVKDYDHGVMDTVLPDGTTRLGVDWALQHPQDYIDVLEYTIPSVLRESGLAGSDIIGLSIDFTACTILPVDASGTPLCFREQFIHRPHAYVKLWKHHAAESQARRIDEVFREKKILDIPRYGGKVSSELMLPKVLQLLEEDPEIYEAADQILEAADWLTQLMTGKKRRSGSTAAYKAMWDEGEGYPGADILKALDPRLERYPEEKLSEAICPVGAKIGELNPAWAKRLGLMPGTAVGASIIDAHAGMPGCGITKPGQMMLIIGTSSVQAVLSDHPYSGRGIMGGVKGGIIPGYYALETGLAGVGDNFEWFIDNALGDGYKAKAKEAGMDIHRYLGDLTRDYMPGESGLLALDWWNGNKTPFVDANLSGAILGYTVYTKPEEIYRALIESTGFGARIIMENFEAAGVQVDEIYACGGIAEKDGFLMQIFADISNREIKVSASKQTAALGAAMYASVAAGAARGGYDHITEAASAMSRIKEQTYKPNAAHVEGYDRLYGMFKELYGYFGEKSNIMKQLKEFRTNSR